MTRQIERLERHVTISNEAIALFVRFWLTSTPPLPDTARAAAQIKGRERYEGFVEALGRRLARGRTLADEVVTDVAPRQLRQGGHRHRRARGPAAGRGRLILRQVVERPDEPHRRQAARDSQGELTTICKGSDP
jgi:hypothetical protein